MIKSASYVPHNRRNIFLTDLVSEDQGDGLHTLTQPLHYIDPWGKEIIVPIGFKTDFSSVPPLARIFVVLMLLMQMLAEGINLWWYVGEAFAFTVVLMAEWLENQATDKIATVHDWIYKTRCRPRWKADWILCAEERTVQEPIILV
jgi:hypothetical protein